jgi:hypothetical protein
MSQHNVEIMHAWVARWNAGERSGLSEYLDPRAELDSPLSSVAGEPYRGYAGFERWLGDLDEQFAQWRVSLEDVRDVGDLVVAIGKVNARGRSSNIDLEFRTAIVVHFGADDRITRARIYATVDDALKAVGLEQ